MTSVLVRLLTTDENFQDAVKDKYSPQYECTVLSDLSVDNIYIPNSEGVSPIQSDVEIGNNNTSVAGTADYTIHAHYFTSESKEFTR